MFTSTPAFQTRLRETYRADGLVPEDSIIYLAATQPASVLGRGDRTVAERLIFALELYAAILGQPHPCLRDVRRDWFISPRERWFAELDKHALNALFHLTQSPLGAEFAEDVHQLRPRIFRLLEGTST